MRARVPTDQHDAQQVREEREHERHVPRLLLLPQVPGLVQTSVHADREGERSQNHHGAGPSRGECQRGDVGIAQRGGAGRGEQDGIPTEQGRVPRDEEAAAVAQGGHAEHERRPHGDPHGSGIDAPDQQDRELHDQQGARQIERVPDDRQLRCPIFRDVPRGPFAHEDAIEPVLQQEEAEGDRHPRQVRREGRVQPGGGHCDRDQREGRHRLGEQEHARTIPRTGALPLRRGQQEPRHGERGDQRHGW